MTAAETTHPQRHAPARSAFPPRLSSIFVLTACASVFGVALLPAFTAQAQVLRPAVFVPLRGSVVRVEAVGTQSRLSIGSGVTVAPAIIVTNCHVTRDATTIRIAGSGNLWEVTQQYADANHDLCFLHAPDWQGKPVILGAEGSLRLGQSVAAMGFTGGMGLSLRFGNVRALHALDGGRVIESDSAFTSGASGGGLFDASGALVGLLTFRSRGSAGSYYAVPARWIRHRLPSDEQWSDVHPLHDAVPFWQRDAQMQPYFMRAAPLIIEGRWIELIELTERWSSTAPSDAEPLRLRAEALQKLDRQQDAVKAFTDVLRLAPNDASAWYGLGLAYAHMGNVVESRRAQSTLASFDRQLAAQLDDAIQRGRVPP